LPFDRISVVGKGSVRNRAFLFCLEAMNRPIPKAPNDRASSGVPPALGSPFEEVADVVDMLTGFDFEKTFDADQSRSSSNLR
jgi:hypothetical protein